MTAGLYVHIPFCKNICGYCDFYTVSARESQYHRYLDALKKEVDLHCRQRTTEKITFETLYFGGGTPSLLSATQLSSIVETLFASVRFVANPEITVEANPGTLDLSKLREYRSVGINRLSLGVQSFHSNELKTLDRDHSVGESVACIGAARKAGFDNVSLDLIFGLPRQTLGNWKKTVDCAVDLGPEHISGYNLTYEEGTPLHEKLQRRVVSELGDDAVKRMYLVTMEKLDRAGYVHYEVSNYARPSFESRHNQKYWNGSPYLGLGVSSHSFFSPRRFWNVRNLKAYLSSLAEDKLPIAGDEILDSPTRLREQVMLGLRQRRGIDLRDFQKTSKVSFFQEFSLPLSKFFDQEFTDHKLAGELIEGKRSLQSQCLEIVKGHLRLTDEGLLLSDLICAELV